MVSKRNTAIGVVAAFSALAFYLAFNSDAVAATIAANGFRGILLYLAADFKNWFIIGTVFLFSSQVGTLKRLGASVLIVLATDIVSFPHLVASKFPLATDPISASLDFIVITRMPFSYSTNFTIFYWVIPTLLFFAAFRMLGHQTFLKKIGA